MQSGSIFDVQLADRRSNEVKRLPMALTSHFCRGSPAAGAAGPTGSVHILPGRSAYLPLVSRDGRMVVMIVIVIIVPHSSIPY